MRRIDERLGHAEYLAGDFFSVADITALVTVDFAGWMKVRLPDDAEHARRWYEAVTARRAWSHDARRSSARCGGHDDSAGTFPAQPDDG